MFSLFALQPLRDLASGVDWRVVKFAMFLAVMALVQGWFRPRRRFVPSTPMAYVNTDCCDRDESSPLPESWATQKPLDEELGFSALELESDSPDTSFGVSALTIESPPRPQKKAKKSVGFALERNEVYEVDYWFDRRIHKHREIRHGWGDIQTIEVSRWIEPDGHNQLHFPRTKWVRDVPDWSVEDQDGDVEMVDD